MPQSPAFLVVVPEKKGQDTSAFEKDPKVKVVVTRGYPDRIDGEKPYVTSIPQQPQTIERQPFILRPDDPLTNPGTARATTAPSRERPNGTTDNGWQERHQHQIVIQQHCDYFDTDKDGILWPSDTYRGFRGFGWSIPLSLLAVVIIHPNLAYPTVPGILPDPFFRIYLSRVYKDKHGSDSMTYDTEGRYRPQQFEDIFAKYDRDGKGGLTLKDLWCFWNGQKMVFDLFGWAATALEWTAVYLLLWPEDGVLRKEDVRGIFDGSIFYTKAEEHAAKQEALRKSGRNTLFERYRWVLSSLLTAAFFIVLLPYAVASLLGVKVMELMGKMHTTSKAGKY